MSFRDVAFVLSLAIFPPHFYVFKRVFRTMGLPRVCKLWLVVSMDMLPVKHPTQKILMAVDYCGRKLA